MSHRRALELAAVVVATGVVAPAALAVPGAVAAPGTVPAGPTVTLLTGDRVTLGGMRGVSVQAAKGRAHVTFLTRQDDQGDTHVIPDDAISLLSSGKLEPSAVRRHRAGADRVRRRVPRHVAADRRLPGPDAEGRRCAGQP